MKNKAKEYLKSIRNLEKDTDTGRFGQRYIDWEWSDDGLNAEFECNICGHKWVKPIGFD